MGAFTKQKSFFYIWLLLNIRISLSCTPFYLNTALLSTQKPLKINFELFTNSLPLKSEQKNNYLWRILQ